MNTVEISLRRLDELDARLDDLEQRVIAKIEHTARIMAKRIVEDELAEVREEMGLE